MPTYNVDNLFSVKGQVVAITGGSGVLGSEMARSLASLGAKVAILGRKKETSQAVVDEITKAGGEAMAISANVLEKPSLEAAQDEIVKRWQKVDILINGAGGNNKSATTGGVNIADQVAPSFFELVPAEVLNVFNLNFLGTLLPTQVFAKAMAERKSGNIINISSMAAIRPLTKVCSYGAAKAAVSNFTQWLATHFAPANVRVNAIAPGFFLTEQNRFLLTDEKTGELTKRGQTIIAHTPMKKFGAPEDLVGALIWLCSPSSSFVTGTVIAVDGGFAAYGGV